MTHKIRFQNIRPEVQFKHFYNFSNYYFNGPKLPGIDSIYWTHQFVKLETTWLAKYKSKWPSWIVPSYPFIWSHLIGLQNYIYMSHDMQDHSRIFFFFSLWPTPFLSSSSPFLLLQHLQALISLKSLTHLTKIIQESH